jgi:RNA polymerase sigma factor (sigma-70 family)
LIENLDDIIKGCMANKPPFQEKLYKIFSKKMFGVCLRYAKDYTAAEDILQDSFIKVFNKISQFKFDGSFEGWMRRIVVNTAIDRLRKQTLLYALTDDYTKLDDYSYDDIVSEISAQDLLKLVQELSPQYRLVFNLFAIEGFSHDEIGNMLGISEGTSKSNLSRARQILQEKVRKNYYLYDSRKEAAKCIEIKPL